MFLRPFTLRQSVDGARAVDLTMIQDSPVKPPLVYINKLVRITRGRIIRKGLLVRTPYTNPLRGRAKRQLRTIPSSASDREESFLTWYTRAAASDTHDVYFIGSKSKDSFWRLVVELREWLTDDDDHQSTISQR
ncbi:uncharacterized protein LOC123226587 [Mangifera indica]|uniref:uncharacterized protein LOC123226587 n=1 Tax=Mangifera indica TaxID=29780 RepID=UPI001CF9D6E3|nr:uncharacterized protein LOC123226587 [Mangifera indica]